MFFSSPLSATSVYRLRFLLLLFYLKLAVNTGPPEKISTNLRFLFYCECTSLVHALALSLPSVAVGAKMPSRFYYSRQRVVRSSHQTVSDCTLRQGFPNTQQSLFLAACRRPEKLFFTFHFWHDSFILDDVKLAELSNNSFQWKNVAFLGSEHTLTPPTYFQGSRPPTPRIYAPQYV